MEQEQAKLKERYLRLAEVFRENFVVPYQDSPGLESQLVPENYLSFADNIVRHYLKLLAELQTDPGVHASRNRRVKTALMSGDSELIATIFGVEMLVLGDPQFTFYAFTEVLRQMTFAPGNKYEEVDSYEDEDEN